MLISPAVSSAGGDPSTTTATVAKANTTGSKLSSRTDNGRIATIKMTLTAPGCGMGEGIAQEVQDKLEALPRVGQVDVEIVFDPPWDRSMMSEDAQLALGL